MLNFSTGFPSRPACANHPESLGRMRPAMLDEICRNYRARPAVPASDLKRIPLGDGLYAYVDAADYEWLSRDNWRLHNGYAARWRKNKRIYMHREIMRPPPGKIVDHMNHNKLDNSRPNLRVCTPAENQRNQRKQHGVASIYKGVSYSKTCGKWAATIGLNRKYTHLGYYDTEIEAARAYDRAAVELFGEFASLNFPEEWPPERRRALYTQRDAGKMEGKKVGRKGGKKSTPSGKRRADVKKTKRRRKTQSA
jgi:hypothetical protein